jgi:hypothetical protein
MPGIAVLQLLPPPPTAVSASQALAGSLADGELTGANTAVAIVGKVTNALPFLRVPGALVAKTVDSGLR